MEFTPLGIDGAWLGSSKVWHDERGHFREWFQVEEIAQATGMKFDVAQANISESKSGVVRGIHYSIAPKGQGKLVTCVSGKIKDVIVDLRTKSSTFGNSVECVLDGGSGEFLLIGIDLGHGFVSLEDQTVVTYLLTSSYSPDQEFGVNPLDPQLAISWGVKQSEMTLSLRDSSSPKLSEQLFLGHLPK